VKNLAIARRYSKALMLIAREDGQAELYRDELQSVVGVIEQNRNLEQAISNPLYSAEDRRKVLEAIIEKISVSKVMTSFFLLLFDKGRIGWISDINDFFQQLADELKGVARADVLSATELSSEAVEKIRASLSARTGKEVILDIKQDESLIGGVVTKIGDLVLDGSIKTQLLNMRESLKRGENV
jgi:F-type H+-transporting ATPase subunit delta